MQSPKIQLKIRKLKDVDIKGKTVLLRLDLDVSLKEIKDQRLNLKYEIEDDTRLVAGLPTIAYLLKRNAKIIICGHLGRPTGSNYESRSRNQEFSLLPIAHWFAKQLNHDSLFTLHESILESFQNWKVAENVWLLENLRFYDEEEKNDLQFSKHLASLADIYVNDAFAMCHRNHASVVGVTKYLPHFAGLHLEKEIEHLSSVAENPKRPLVVIIGGKKIETKLPLVLKMYQSAEYILVGGKIAEESQEFLKVEHEKISGKKALLLVADLNNDKTGIMENSLINFVEIIERAGTIIWNGSMGLVENNDDYNHASKKIARAIAESKGYSVVGGGDTTEFLRKIKMIDNFNFVSTGGGAMLAFLSGEKLPGIEVLLT